MKRSFRRRRERIRREYLARMGDVLQRFREYLEQYFGGLCDED